MTEKIRTLPKFYLKFANSYKNSFILLFSLTSIRALLDTLSPYFFKNIIDALTNMNPASAYTLLFIPIAIYIGSIFASDCLVRLVEYIETMTIPHILGQIRTQTFSHLLKHSHRFYQEELVGKLANKISDIARGFDELYFTFHYGLYPITLSFALSAALMWKTHPAFALSLIVWYFSFVTVSALISIRNIPLIQSHSEALSKVFGKIVDSLSNVSAIRFFSGQHNEIGDLAYHQNDEIKKAQNVDRRILKLRFCQGLCSNVLMVFFFYLLLDGWRQGTISAGDFTFIIQGAFSLIRSSIWTADRIAKAYRIFGSAKQAYKIMTAPLDIRNQPHALPLKVKRGQITFEKVTFNYGSQPLFSNLDLSIKPGEKVGIVGFSGSGKTTFVNLLLRLFDVEEGRILIDGQDIRSVTQESLRSSIAFIPQDPALFHRTLMENIRYGTFSATDEEVIAAAKVAHCHPFILNIKDKYHSIVGERGIKLSQGQRQRIAIARAVLKNAPILVLDEATSALDSITERKIQESLDHLMKDRTVIAIAHRLSTLLGMDRIIVFSQGKIIESGSHEELLQLNGQYARLWQMQYQGSLAKETREKIAH